MKTKNASNAKNAARRLANIMMSQRIEWESSLWCYLLIVIHFYTQTDAVRQSGNAIEVKDTDVHKRRPVIKLKLLLLKEKKYKKYKNDGK